MKNICIFNSLPFWGGGEKVNLEMAIELRSRGMQVYFIAQRNGFLWKRARALCFSVFSIKVGRLSFLNPFKVFRLIWFFYHFKIDTLIFSNSLDYKQSSIAAKIAGVKRIIYQRGITLPIKARFLNRLIFNRILTHIIVNSKATKKSVLQNLNKYINYSKVHIVNGGIDISWISNKNKYLKEIKEKKRGVIFGNAARLSAEKGQLYLIEIAKKLKKMQVNFTLFIAGEGEEMKNEIARLIRKNNLKKEVIMFGFVADMEAFMESIDIFVYTSLREGFGFVLAEAMAKEVPVVCFNQSGMKEVVTNNKSGFLIDFPDMEDFTNKTKLLIEDESLRNKMGKQAKQEVIDRFLLKDKITEFIDCVQNH